MKFSNTIFVIAALLVASSSAEDPWTPSPLCPFPSEKQTRYPYEGDCTKYWECFEGARYPMNCPAGLEFNAETAVCDNPTIANCNPDATISYPTFSHSTLSTPSTVSTPDPGPLPECPFPSNEMTYFPVVNNCAQYWECFQGNRFLMNCPSGLYWNQKLKYCDYPGNVDCKPNNVTTTTTPATTTVVTTTITTPSDDATTDVSPNWTPDPQCPYPSSDEITFFPHPTNCTQYYECYRGDKYLMDCPGGLFWNDWADVCDYEENVDCTRPTKPSSSTPSPTQPAPPNAVCDGQPNGTFLPHATDCRKFYECNGGKAIEESCPANLLWHPESHTCDYPENVKCAH